MAERQGLVLRTEHFHLDWTLKFTRPTIVIDGHSMKREWGEHFFPLEPGHHQVEVFYRYLGRRAGRVSAEVEIDLNKSQRATYRAPNSVLIAFLPGKLCLDPGK